MLTIYILLAVEQKYKMQKEIHKIHEIVYRINEKLIRAKEHQVVLIQSKINPRFKSNYDYWSSLHHVSLFNDHCRHTLSSSLLWCLKTSLMAIGMRNKIIYKRTAACIVYMLLNVKCNLNQYFFISMGNASN